MKRGEQVAIQISDLPTGTWGYGWIVLGAAVALVVAGSAYRFIGGGGRHSPVRPKDRSHEEALADKRMALMEAIAELDDQFEAGEVSREPYERDRSQLKEELMRVMRGLGTRGD